MANLAGKQWLHRFVTDQCRTANGDDACVQTVIQEAQKTLDKAMERVPRGQGYRIHLAVTVEHPSEQPAQAPIVHLGG